MGRDASINIYNKESYRDYNKSLKEYYDMIDELKLNQVNEFDIVNLKKELVTKEDILYEDYVCILYKGKSECKDLVKIMRKYNPNDGDFIVTKEILDDLDDNQFLCRYAKNLGIDALKSMKRIVIYNTNDWK